jgi:hypothetical protein
MKPVDKLQAEPRRIGDDDLRQLFLDARPHNGWLDKPVSDAMRLLSPRTIRPGTPDVHDFGLTGPRLRYATHAITDDNTGKLNPCG